MSHQRLTRGAFLERATCAVLALSAVPRAAMAQTDWSKLSDDAWKKRLSPERYAVLREADTELAWSSPLEYEHRRGTYACAGCDLGLFSSATKFDSGTGWPSFYTTLPHAVKTREDDSLGVPRTEVQCSRCEGHLGHVFDDGPPPTGLRYCINGLAMTFHPKSLA